MLVAEKLGGQVFLNFGRYFKEDFTAVIDARALRLFAKADSIPHGSAAHWCACAAGSTIVMGRASR